MNREQLAHVVRAAATITGDGDIVIIGSQSILGTSRRRRLAGGGHDVDGG
jgi:hypothetical protein